MGGQRTTTEIIDKILMASTAGTVITTSLFIPGAAIAFGPILDSYFKGYNRRQRDREYRRLIAYMKHQKLLALEPRKGNGLVITEKGQKRAKKAAFSFSSIPVLSQWDKRWRLLFFDIPEPNRKQRNCLIRELKRLGFYQLQRSVWVHPYPCRDQVETIAAYYGIEKYLVFLETSYIDRQDQLRQQFPSL